MAQRAFTTEPEDTAEVSTDQTASGRPTAPMAAEAMSEQEETTTTSTHPHALPTAAGIDPATGAASATGSTPYLRRSPSPPRRIERKFALAPAFLEKWRTKPPPFGFNGLGELVYRRTYSRKKIVNGVEQGENEQWWETVARVVNGTYNMQKTWIEQHDLGWNAKKAQKSAQEMFQRMFEMKFLPPGRGLWAMGSPITEQRGLFSALNNCGFVTTEGMEKELDKSKPFTFLMDASMLGVGVGFDTKGAGKVPILDVRHLQARTFQIPDDREGWVESLRQLINSYMTGRDHVEFDYSKIRPFGTPIRGFGGVASGPAALKELHESVRSVLDARVGSHLTMTDIADIMNMIGRCVIAGNVRRTAEIVFGPPDSEEYLNLKNYEKNPQRSAWSWASNNSVFAELGMDYSKICEHVKRNGEPGFAWLENMQKFSRMNGVEDNRDHRVRGGNPCLEQSLESYELCFPVDETRVMTDRGFLFYNELEQLEDRGEAVQYACYDVAAKQLVYRPGVLKREFVPEHAELVDFTQETEAKRNWSATSGAYGSKQAEDEDDRSNHLSLLVTREHDMYVQLGRESSGEYAKLSWRKVGTGIAPPSKFAAASLLPSAPEANLPQPRAGPKSPYTHVRFVCAAEHGIGGATPDGVTAELMKELDLQADHVAHFLELYGFWLGDGTLDARAQYVMFNQHKESDNNWLMSVIPLCGLVESRDWTKHWNPSNSRWDVRITKPSWYRFFAAEYGIKYGHTAVERAAVVAPAAADAMAVDADVVEPLGEASMARFAAVADRAAAIEDDRAKDLPIVPVLPERTVWRDFVRVIRGPGDYPAATAESTCRILYQFHGPMSAQPGCAADGTVSATFRVLMRAAEVAGVQFGAASGHLFSELVPLVWPNWWDPAVSQLLREAPHGVGTYVPIARASAQAAVQTGARVVIAFGNHARERFGELKLAATVEQPVCRGVTTYTIGGTTVVTSPHPSETSCEGQVAAALLLAETLAQGLPLSSVLGRVRFLAERELWTKSAKWFAPWVSRCNKEQLRLVLNGFWRADGAWAHQKKSFFTSSVPFRDELMKVLMHAGYSAFFALLYRSGEERGSVDGHTIVATRDGWIVKFTEPDSPAGQTHAYPNIPRSDIRSVPYAGKVWCVKVQHDDHLIVAQRAHRVDGVTTKASRPTIVGNCCLVETFPSNHADADDYYRTLKYAYLYAKTVTLGKTQWPETNRVMLRNRRIGCSVSGVAQFISQRGVHVLKDWLEGGYAVIQKKDQEFSDWFAIPRSIKTTSVKPSGTVSLLAGATPGMHYPESRFYIRRMRLSSASELVAPLVEAGYPVEPAKDGDGKTLVVEFPIDVGAGVRVQSSVSMWEQLSLAAFLQRHWADNQVSCTVTFDPETEAQHLAPALDYFQYQLKGISFLPKLKEGAYPQMPYEAITEEEYQRRFAMLKPLDLGHAQVSTHETQPEKFCDSDVCNLDGPPADNVGELDAMAEESSDLASGAEKL